MICFFPCVSGIPIKSRFNSLVEERILTDWLSIKNQKENILNSYDLLFFNNIVDKLPEISSIVDFLPEISRKKSKFIQGEFIIKFRSNVNIEYRLSEGGIAQTGVPCIDQLNKQYT